MRFDNQEGAAEVEAISSSFDQRIAGPIRCRTAMGDNLLLADDDHGASCRGVTPVIGVRFRCSTLRSAG